MGKLNVAIADDNEVMRDLLEEMVTSDDELHLIGMAKDGEEACHLQIQNLPHHTARNLRIRSCSFSNGHSIFSTSHKVLRIKTCQPSHGR